jgi:phosphoserine phosphatase
MLIQSILYLIVTILIESIDGFVNSIDHPAHPSSYLESSATDATNIMELFSETSIFHANNDGLSRRRRWLVVDFDGTCTEHDTTPLLPKLASFAARSRSSLSASKKESSLNDASNDRQNDSQASDDYDHEQDLQKRLRQFQELEDEFMKRYSDAKNNLLSGELAENHDNEQRLQSMHDVLDALDEPSTTVTHMVSASRVLHSLGHADSTEIEGMLNVRGVSTKQLSYKRDDSKGDGSCNSDEKVDIHLRPGCETTLARILLSHSAPCIQDQDEDIATQTSCLGWSLAVLSINWCPALIEASLVQPILRKKRSILSQQHCETEVPVWSNTVDGNGMVTLLVPGALAKRDRIIELRRCLENAAPDKHLIVYVGDSSTDLAALLEADIGVVMGSSSSTRSIAEKWGVEILPLEQRHEHDFGVVVTTGRKRLWQTDDWNVLNDMLTELDC